MWRVFFELVESAQKCVTSSDHGKVRRYFHKKIVPSDYGTIVTLGFPLRDHKNEPYPNLTAMVIAM